MDRTIAKGLCIGALFWLAGIAQASERWATLEAIHWVENPRNSPKPGKHGELGAYQFLPSTWRMHTDIPFGRAVIREYSDVVAVQHYEWIRRGLVRAGLAPSAYNIALAWNAGLGATQRGQATRFSHDYAARVHNIVEMFKQRQIASK